MPTSEEIENELKGVNNLRQWDDDNCSENSGPILDEEFLKNPTAGLPF